MQTPPVHGELTPTTSKLIAEALVGRHGPRQIAARANDIGLPKPLTNVIVAACAATATDPASPRGKRVATTYS